MRKIRFTFLCNNAERKVLTKLSEIMARSQSDTIRWLIVHLGKELGIVVDDHDEHGDKFNKPCKK